MNPRPLLLLVTCLVFVASPLLAGAEMRFVSANGNTASAPVKGGDVRRIELHKAAPGQPGVLRIDVITRGGQVHQLSLSGGELVRVEFTPGHVPPPPVPTPSDSANSPFGCGKASYADEVVLFSPGSPGPIHRFSDPTLALGAPDGRAVALGCGGKLALGWQNAYLMDVPGPDLRIATAVTAPADPGEEFHVLLRLDSTGEWTNCGTLREGEELDINGCGPPGMRYNQVLLKDSGKNCKWPAPGADVDAVIFLGCVGGD